MIDVSAIENTFASIVSQLANLAGELRSARVLTDNSTDQCEIGDARTTKTHEAKGKEVKKTWYRVTLDVAYEGEILDREGKPLAWTGAATDEARAKEVLTKVVKHDLDVALRNTPAGPVDWDLVNVEPRR